MILITDYLHLKSIGNFFVAVWDFEVKTNRLNIFFWFAKESIKDLQFPKQLRGLAAQENKKTHLTDSFCSGHYKG